MFTESKNLETTEKTNSETKVNRKISLRTRAMSGVLGVSLFVTLASAACDAKANNISPIGKTEQSRSIETPKSNFTIEIDAQMPQVSPITGRSTQEDVQIINQLLEIAPKIGKLNIVLTDGDHELETTYGTIFVNRNHMTPAGLKYETAHLITHVDDPNVNIELASELTKEDNDQLITYRHEALDDPTWGREYPLFDKIFSTEKVGIAFTPITPDQTIDQTRILTNLYADSVWVLGKKRPFEQGIQPFAKYLDPINTYQASQSHIGDITIGDFLNSQKDTVDKLSKQFPILALAFNKLKTKNFDMNEKNLIWLQKSPAGQNLTDGTEGSTWKVTYILANTILLELLNNRDPQLMTLIPDSELPTVTEDLNRLKAYADSEKMAELGAATLAGQKTTSYSLILEKLNNIASK